MKCSCCGGYCEKESPGQDKGYGICESCDAWITERDNRQLDDLAAKIEAALNPENRAKFAAMDTDKRRWFAMQAREDGLVTYSIASREQAPT